ncbi:hypothetical protein ATCC90586_000555 [Pythium insidiosum]|nr:hypothetical protein ATCC90586_000555 [Pythium insidiosum]
MADESHAESALRLWLDLAVLQPADHNSIHSLQNDVLESLRSGELPLKRAINQTLAAAWRCQERATESHLRALVAAAAADDVLQRSFPAAFSAVLAARARALAQSFASARLVALRLSCALLAAAAPEPSAPWVAELAATQGALLEAMLGDTPRVQAAARKALLRVLRQLPALAPTFAATVTAAQQPRYHLWLVLSLASALPEAAQEAAWAAYVGWAFEAKTRVVVPLQRQDARFRGLTAARFESLLKPTLAKLLKKSPDSVLEATIELVRAVPLDLGPFVAELFSALLLAKLRSTKEDVRGFTVALARELLAGFTSLAHVELLVAPVAALVDGKHGLLAQFYMREAAFAVLADAADAVVAGSLALGAPDDAARVAQTVVAPLLKAVDKEAHDATRHLGLLALGKWLALGAQPLPADALRRLQSGIAHKSDAVVAGFVRAAAVLLVTTPAGARAAVASALSPLAPELARVALAANKKPTVAHVDGVLALGLAGMLALEASDADRQLAAAGLPALLTDASFVLPSVRLLLQALASAQDNGRDAARLRIEAAALETLPAALTWVLASAAPLADAEDRDELPPAYTLLVELLTCNVLPARAAAERAVASVYASSLAHADGLLRALQRKLAAAADQLAREQAQYLSRRASSVDEPSASAVVPHASVVRRALRTLAPPALRDATAAATRARVLPRVLWLAHHPFAVDGASPEAFGAEWRSLKLRFLPQTEEEEDQDQEEEAEETADDRIDHLLEAHASIKTALVALLADETLLSARREDRVAAQRTLATLLQFAGNGEGESIALQDVLQDALLPRVAALALDEVTDDDVAMLATPDGELFVPSAASANASASGASQATPKPRRSAGGGRRGNEDEQWEQQVREELAKKKQQQQPKKLTPEEKALLAQQTARRAELRSAVETVDRVLEALTMLATTRPDELHAALPALLRCVRGLFATPLVHDAAALCVHALARTLSPDAVREHAADLASCLTVVLRLEHADREASSDKSKALALAAVRPFVERALLALMTATFGFEFDSEDDYDASAPLLHALPPPTFHLVLPVLRAVLLWLPAAPSESESEALRHWALPLLAAHARMIRPEEEEDVGDAAAQRLLRREMLELVLTLLARGAAGDMPPISNADLAPAKLLTSLCVGPRLSTSEWTPLLGDRGLLAASSDVRGACLKALRDVAATDAEDEEEEEDEHVKDEESEQPATTSALRTAGNPLLRSRLFLSCFDGVESNKAVAREVWALAGAQLTPLYAGQLLVLLSHSAPHVRESAALALADGMAQFPATVAPLLTNLQLHFASHVPPPVELLDEFGNPMLRRPGQSEPAEEPATALPRVGVALALEKLAARGVPLDHALVVATLRFVLDSGLADQNGAVRAQMRKTGIALVDVYGGGAAALTRELLTLLEQALEHKPTESQDAAAMERYDHQREGIVVCLGALAKHMDKSDPKVSSTVDLLVDALAIPSESVQRAVATCLAPLVAAVRERSPALLSTLLTRATSAETFGERIGAAFGVSAVVKGLGISALKQQDVIPRIEELMKSGGAPARQGAMLIFECLSERLGLLFEPYIIVILPIMLKCFADASPPVREAASQTSRKIMGNLSAHGVKLVLPSLLRSMEDGAWRTKQAGIQLLGSMAYCAPRQLGSCLPQVVPKITDALTDSHPKVREASKAALRDIGSVVRNPEIASIAPALLNALEDPNRHTNDALQQLQSTTFQHSIDAPSLALVMPIITRGLRDRGGDAKKKAALIVGSMCSMINDAKDLVPYMEMVLPSLKTLLLDPIPEVRAVAAKAMGKLVKGLGESHFSDILTWLLEAIKGDYGSVERSGAAQGLCEVLVALGRERVEATLLHEIFPLSRHPKFSVREGVLWIIAFLPPALGKGFAVFLSDALPIIVSGLSDEADSVRDVAVHAGHVVVNAHALSHTRDILPSLEAGLFDDSWRIRQSSVTLLGDLMYRISGTRAVGLSDGGDDDDDDAAGSAAGDKAIIKTLGMERRNAILASLYLIRSDTSAVVRQSALQVWKSVVANTPKTLRQILETLMGVIVSALSGDHVEKQTMAGRTLGEIVRKLGENVLPEVVPILRDGLAPTNAPGMRQGACIGLAEVIECCTKKQLEDFVSTLVDAVLDGLCDDLPLVRSSAAQAFDVLQRSIGYRAIDETVPSLLQRIRSTNVDAQERALLGLQDMLRVKSREVLPYLIPRLLTTPVTSAAVRAISRVAQATGAVIHFQLEKIFATFIPAYLASLERQSTLADEIKLALRDVVLAIEEPGVHWLAIEVCKHCESDVVAERALAFYLIAEFGGHTTTHYGDQVPLYLRQIVVHLNDPVEEVVRAASDALKGLNATLRPEDFAKHVDFIRQTINSQVSEARHRKGGVGANAEYLLPGLCIPKGLEPFLPSYQYALMNGSPELRQSAAAGLGELVQLSSGAALRPYLIKLTGPLIRIAGDRFPGHVKAAILETLEIILQKGGVALKPFLPQLQTTFVKALNDTASEVRRRGTSALSKLVALSPRIDPLVAELTEKLATTSGGIREANIDALVSILQRVGDKIAAPVRSALEDALSTELLADSEDSLRERAARCLAHAVATDSEQGAAHAVRFGLADAKDAASAEWTRKHSAALFWETLLSQRPSWAGEVAAPAADVLVVLGGDEHIAVRAAAIRAIAALVKQGLGSVDAFVPILVQGIQHPNKDVAKSAVKIAKHLAKRDPDAMRAHVATLVPATFGLIKSNNIAAKMSAERALLYLLEVQTRAETLAAYVRSDAVNGKIIAEYARRVLAKLKADSGDESE